jgi:hypothetical protein
VHVIMVNKFYLEEYFENKLPYERE